MNKFLKTSLGVFLGNTVIAFSVAAFVVPHGILMGGSTGIGLTITHYLPFELSMIIFLINMTLFLIGTFTLGKKFAVTTIASTIIYPAMLAVIQQIPGITELTDNILLATIYSGVLTGIGIGLVVRQGASTGGTDIVALVAGKYLHYPVAILMYVVDFIVIGMQVMFSTSEQILYGILGLVLLSIAMDKVVIFGQSQIQLMIISEKYELIRQRLLKDMDLGATMLFIEKGYSKEKEQGIMCVLSHRKLYDAKAMIAEIDDKAFITITQVQEVRGRGFTLEKVHYENMMRK